MPPPRLNGILESALIVKDLERARAFYEDVLGLRVFSDSEAGCGFEVAKGQLLLLVTEKKAHLPSETPGGTRGDVRGFDVHVGPPHRLRSR